jgi:two-component system response regulator ResD
VKRIIVADDNQEVAEVFRRLLLRRGYEVTVVANGQELLDNFREKPAEGVIVDLEMPVKDGCEAIEELRTTYPGVKIVAVSGGAVQAPSVLKKGANAFLSKSEPPRKVVACIEELIRAAS